jgi:hypothetical protein
LLTPFAIVHDEHLHLFMIPQSSEEFGRDEKVLTGILPTRDINQLVMDASFGSLVHTLFYQLLNP